MSAWIQDAFLLSKEAVAFRNQNDIKWKDLSYGTKERLTAGSSNLTIQAPSYLKCSGLPLLITVERRPEWVELSGASSSDFQDNDCKSIAQHQPAGHTWCWLEMVRGRMTPSLRDSGSYSSVQVPLIMYWSAGLLWQSWMWTFCSRMWKAISAIHLLTVLWKYSPGQS